MTDRQRGPRPDRGLVLHGMVASGGSGQGRARLVRSLAEAALVQPGEIAVTPALSPVWMPLMASAAGIVADTGSILSNGAIIARELGIPALVGVAGATAAIRSGQLLALDGTRGTVRLVPDRRAGAPAGAEW